MTGWTKKTSSGVISSSSPNIKDFYKSSKNGKKISFVGDSTTDIAPALYSRLDLYKAVGGWLQGITYVNRGNNGGTVRDFVSSNTTRNNLTLTLTDNADLYVLSYGINDIRVGGDANQIRADLKTAIDSMLAQPQAYVLIRVPNTFLTTNTSNWVVPNSSAQEYSSRMWEICESFRGYSDRLDIIDIPNLIFGRKAVASHPLMLNQLHPNDFGYSSIADEITELMSGQQKNDFNTFNDYEVIAKGWVQTPSTDITTSTFKFFTNSVKTLQIDDIVYLGNSYSFAIDQTPTVSSGFWTITHGHTGSFNKLGVVRIMRKKS
jgi:lysophospholipase L1-like esterase